MSTIRAVSLWFLTAVTVVLTALLVLSGEGEAEKVVIDDDWVVDTSLGDVLSDNEYVMRANLTITGTGQISFRRCTLTFMADTPARYGVTVMPGGYLLAHTSTFEKGYLAPTQEAEPWTFYVQESGRMYLEKCDISGIGVQAAAERGRGLAIKSNNVRISNSTFTDCERGLVIMAGANPVLTDNLFEDNTAGIEVTGSPFQLKAPNEFRENNFGIVFTNCNDGFLGAGSFVDNMWAVQSSTSNVRIRDVTMEGMGESIFSGNSASVVAVDCTIYTMHGRGTAMFMSSILMVNCETTDLMAFTETDSTSSVVSNVSIEFLVKYAGAGYPVDAADVQLYDRLDDLVYKQVTDASGLTPLRQITVYEHRGGQHPIDHQPFYAEVAKGFNYVEKRDITLLPHHLVQVDFIDTEPPELTVSSPTNGSLFNSTDVALTGTVLDMHSGMSGLYYIVNGGVEMDLPMEEYWTVSADLWEGDLTILIVATDLLGNTAEVTLQIFIDITPPGVLTIDPPSGSITRAYQLLVSGLTEPGTALTRDGEDLEVAENGSFTGYVMLGDAEGEQTVTFQLTDAAGNVDTFVYAVLVDRTPPDLVADTSPDYRDFPIINRSRILMFGTTEPGARVEVMLNDDLANSTVADELGRWSMDIDLMVGENDLLVDVFDEAGNRESVEVIRFLYDITPPDISIINPKDGSTSDQGTVLVRVRTEYGAKVWVNDGQEKLQPSHGEVEFENIRLDVGENTILVHAMDKAGNVATKTIYVFYEPGDDNGGGDGAGFPWWIVIAAVVLGVVAFVVVMRVMKNVG